MLSIDQLTTPLTQDAVRADFVGRLVGLGIPADKWRKGGALSVMLTVTAAVFAGFTTLLAAAIKSGFLDFAEGPWLTLVAFYVYGVSRVEATFATGQVQLTNSGGGLYTLAAGAYQVENPTTGKVYANTSPFTLNPSSTLQIDIQAVEIGAASSSPAGTITAQQTSLLGVTVTNLTDVVGTDAEGDATLQQRCRDKLATLSGKGATGAYRYAVLSALRPDGTPVDINRVAKYADPDTGIVTLYAASPSGAPTTLDLGFASDNVEKLARPDTDRFDLFAATPIVLAASLVVWATRTDGVSASDLQSEIQAALDAAVEIYPIGGIPQPPSTAGFLYASFIDGVVKSVHPSIYAVSGATDLPLTVGEVATLSVSIDVRLVEASS